MKLQKIGNVYHAKFKTADGRSTTLTTRSSDKREAERIVKESGMKDLERAAKSGRLTNEVIGRLTAGKKLTLLKAVDVWREWMTSIGKAPKTVYSNASTVLKWLKDMDIENLPPASANEKHVSTWINDSKSEIKAHTREVNLASVRTFFTFLSAKGWIVGDPSRLVRVRMDLLSHAQKETIEKVPFTKSEVNRLLKYLHDNENQFWEFAVRISDEVGLRLGDICQLEWDCFTKPGRIIVWTDKRDKRVSVPVSSELEDLVAQIPVISEKYLFPEQRLLTTDLTRRALLSMQFKRICERVEITGKTFHNLRHTCVSRWVKEGRSLESIGKDVGHAHTKTTEGYSH